MADIGARYTDAQIHSLERRIRSVYRNAQKDLKGKYAAFVEGHKKRAAVMREKLARDEITEDEYRRWMAGQVFQGNQWKAKIEQMTASMSNYNQIAQGIINDDLNGVFAVNANYQAYKLEHGAGINFGFGLYDAGTVARLIRDEPQLLPKYQLNIPKDRRWNQKKISQQITQGIIQGERLEQIAARLSRVTDGNMALSLTRARTAMTGAQNAGRQETLQRAERIGVKTHKEWLATLDSHTRHQHRDLDGQVVPLDKPFTVGADSIRYPGDPLAAPYLVYNCRCTMIGAVDDYPDEYNAQRYDNIEGKPIKDMTYREWEKAKGKAVDLHITAVCEDDSMESKSSKPKNNKLKKGEKN